MHLVLLTITNTQRVVFFENLSYYQLMGYGLGFIESWWKRCVRGQDELSPCERTESERQAFEQTFYK